MRGWQEWSHLAARFLGSLSRAEPPATDLAWLESLLSDAEREQLEAMPVADRRHAVSCGRKAQQLLGGQATNDLIVASALHDVGKTEAKLGTVGRVAATLVGTLASPRRLESWPSLGGWRCRVALYLAHDVRGAELLEELGSAPEVVTWAREHHLPESEWSLSPDVATALAQADLVSGG